MPLTSPLTLFRDEASRPSSQGLIGSVLVVSPPSRWAYVALGLIAAMIVVGILLLGHYTARERVSGQLVASNGIETTVARSAGIIAEIKVGAGDRVTKGEPLLIVSGDSATVRAGQAHGQIEIQLASQVAGLHRSLSDRALELQAAHRANAAKLVSLNAELHEINSQLDLSSRQIDEATALQGRFEPLVRKGIVSGIQAQQQRDSLYSLKNGNKVLLRQQIDVRRQLDDLASDDEHADIAERDARGVLERQISELRQQLAENDIQRSTVLVAQSSGVVSSVMATTGQAVREGQSLISILPAGSVLRARMLASGKSVAMVHRGTRVVIRYRAYPYQRYGQQEGTVTDVSPSALSAPELASLTGHDAATFPDPLFQVTVQLQNAAHDAPLNKVRLMPGMVLDADLILGSHRLVEWIVGGGSG